MAIFEKSSEFLEDYRRGLDMIYAASSNFYNFVAAMGTPISDENIPTACVSWDAYNKKIAFRMNPSFIHDLKDEELGAILCHETYHVILNHLMEKIDGSFERIDVLSNAHECIINDGILDNVGLPLPEGGMYGTELYGTSFASMTSRQGYDYIMSQMQSEDSEDDAQGDSETDSNDSAGSGSSSDSGDSQDDSKSMDDENSEDSDDGSGSDDSDTDSDDENDSDDQDENSDEDSSESDDSATDEDSDVSDDGADEDTQDENDSEKDDSREGSKSHSHVCAGVQVDAKDAQDVQDAINAMIQDVIDNMNPQDVPMDVADNLPTGVTMNNGMSTGAQGSFVSAPSAIESMNMNWRSLLAKIDPKILDSGKRRENYDWTRPPHAMRTIYPSVILPSSRRETPKSHGKGDSLATVVVALDLSPSIPRELVNKLVSLVEDIPSNLMNAIPVTWSSDVVPYDESRKIVDAIGTDVNNLHRWVSNLPKGKGKHTEPYVVVITDGQFHLATDGFYKGTSRETMQNNWHWVAIQNRDVASIERNVRDHLNAAKDNIYKLSDFSES